MKILHIFDCAAVACTISKFLEKKGHDSHVISFKRMDPFGFVSFYGYECLDTEDPTEFYLNAIDRATDYDVIHVHFVWGVIPYLRNKYANTKKIILHYHGSDIRQFQNDPKRIRAEQQADYVIGSTKELEKYSERVHHIPNPIDTDHFKKQEKDWNNPKYFTIIADEEELVKQHIKDLGIDCHFMVRKKVKLAYESMPKLFSEYTHYVDVKYQDGKLLPTDSKTGYEALSCGLKRVNNDGTETIGLPKYLDAEEIVDKIESIYQS